MNNEIKNGGKKARSRKKIMHAAKRLFEEKGIENVTFTDVASEAGVCRTTVFNHFSNTDELLSAMFRQEISDVEEHCNSSNAKGRQLLEVFFDKLIEDTAYYPVLAFRLMNSAVAGGNKGGRVGNEGSMVKFEEFIEYNIPVDIKKRHNCTLLIMGAYYGLVNHYHSTCKTFDAANMKREFKELLDMILGGN